MTLPKLSMPTFEVERPSNKTKVKIRPETAKEEKILLIAKEGNDNNEILTAVKQIVNNCLVDFPERIDSMTLFDLEYLFLRIQAVSESNKVKLAYRDNEDNKVRDFEVDLDKVTVTFPEKDLSLIKVNDKVSLQLKYPAAALYDDKDFLNLSGEKAFEELSIRCLDKIYENNVMIDPKIMKKEEIKEWLDTLPKSAYTQIKEFFVNMPTLKHEITYTNDNGHERKIILSTLNDFFSLR